MQNHPTNSALRRAAFLALLCSACAFPSSASIRVGAGGAAAGCDAATIQDAVAIAEAQSGADDIRLSRDLAYSGLVTIDATLANEAITISGGWDDCMDATTGGRTVVGARFQVVGTAAPGSEAVAFESLDVHIPAGEVGVSVIDQAWLSLSSVLLHGAVTGLAASDGAHVTLDAASEIYGNDSTMNGVGFGGGVQCGRVALSNTGATILISGKIHHNKALRGGGIAATDSCFILLQEGSRVYENEATGLATGGGGAYIDGGAILFTDGDVSLHDNRAREGGGGGIHLQGPDTLVAFGNASILDNQAIGNGGGVQVKHGALFLLFRLSGYACADPPRCSAISGNHGLRGSAVYVEGAGSKADLRQAYVDGNRATDPAQPGCVLWAEETAELYAEGLQLWNNQDGGLFCASAADVEAGFISAAGNSGSGTEGSAAPFGAVGYDDGSVFLFHSAFDDIAGFWSEGTGFVSADCVIADVTAGLLGRLVTEVTDPGFFDPQGGDLRLAAGSAAIDYCDDLFNSPLEDDIDLEMRGVDEPDQANGIGPFDLGFDEYNHASAGIFADGFESGNTTRWSSSAP